MTGVSPCVLPASLQDFLRQIRRRVFITVAVRGHRHRLGTVVLQHRFRIAKVQIVLQAQKSLEVLLVAILAL